MKKLIILLALTTFLISCKSTQGHCDAYGNKSAIQEQEENFDIYSSNSNTMSKYVTSLSIK